MYFLHRRQSRVFFISFFALLLCASVNPPDRSQRYLRTLAEFEANYQRGQAGKRDCRSISRQGNSLTKKNIPPPKKIRWDMAEYCRKWYGIEIDSTFVAPRDELGTGPKTPFQAQWLKLLENWNYKNHETDWPIPHKNRSIESSSGPYSGELGPFRIHWDATKKQLVINHVDGDKAIFASNPDQPFFIAARGKEDVAQWRGSFTFMDQRDRHICSNQTIETIKKEGAEIIVTGLIFGPRCEANYRLKFRKASETRLQFQAQVEEKAGTAKLNRLMLAYYSSEKEEFYGFGEQFTHHNLKGFKVPIVAQEQGHLRGLKPWSPFLNRLSPGSAGDWYTTYTAIPQYITSENRSLFLENSEYALFDLSKPQEVELRVWSGDLRGQIIFGETPLDLIESFTEYSGRMRPLPDWFHAGAIVGIMGGSERVRKIWQRLKVLKTPIAGFWLQDWVGKRNTGLGVRMWWNWELDKKTYPDWPTLVADFKREGIETLGYFNPFLTDAAMKEGVGENLFQTAKESHFLVRKQDGTLAAIDSGGFEGHLVDFTNPEARAWYIDKLSTAIKSLGMRGWMSDFGEALPFEAKLDNGLSGAEYHNRYGEEWIKVNREIRKAAGLEADGVYFTRTATARSHGSASLYWLGDQMVTWDEHDGLKSSIAGLLSGGISGMAINHGDIGGLIGMRRKILGQKIEYRRDQELMLRWSEMAAFTPSYRTHEGNNPKQNHQFYTNFETLKGFSYFAKVFRALKEYRKSLFKEAADKGYPVVRHPMLHYPEDPQARKLRYQFMLGPDFMIAPVTEKGKTVASVYLPKGEWRHIWSEKVFDTRNKGRRINIPSPVGFPPVFFRTSSKQGKRFQSILKKIYRPKPLN